jgi:hypothetical protein
LSRKRFDQKKKGFDNKKIWPKLLSNPNESQLPGNRRMNNQPDVDIDRAYFVLTRLVDVNGILDRSVLAPRILG